MSSSANNTDDAKKARGSASTVDDAIAAKTMSVFNSTDLRDAIVDRVSAADFRARVIDAWRGWGRKEVEARLAPCLAEVKDTFSRPPFSSSLVFTTFDWPATADGLVAWLAAVVHAAGSDNAAAKALPLPASATPAGVKAALLERFPRMRENPQTEAMMADMILPFRAAVQAQAVAFAIDEAAKDIAAVSGAPSPAAPPPTPANGGPAPSSPPKLPPRPLTAAERHALAHVAGGEDTLRRIHELRDNADTAALRKLRAQAERRGHVTRYIDYQLLFLEADVDDISDAEFAERLRPLADAGLAFAQHDVGALLLKLAAAQHKLQQAQWEQQQKAAAAPAASADVKSKKGGKPPSLPSTPPPPGDVGPSPKVTEGADATERECPLETAVAWVRRSVSRGGATMSPTEVEAVNYLERASSLGHTEARTALGTWHVARASCIAAHGAMGEQALLSIKAPAKRTPPAKGPAAAATASSSPPASNNGSKQPSPKATPAPTPRASLGGEQVDAWSVAAKYHVRAALRAVEDVAEGIAPVWDRAEHSEHVDAAKDVVREATQVRQLLKAAAKRAAGGSELDVLNPWMREALGAKRDGWWLTKALKIFLVAAGLGAVYMAYVLYTAPPSQCRAGFADSDRLASSRRGKRRGGSS